MTEQPAPKNQLINPVVVYLGLVPVASWLLFLEHCTLFLLKNLGMANAPRFSVELKPWL